MERMHLAVILVALAVAAVALVGLLSSGLIQNPPTCPLRFSVRAVNTTFGWIYVVEYLQGTPLPLSEYNVTFYRLVPAGTGDPVQVIDYEGSLTGLVGASGNKSFQDRGSMAGYLDDHGDYFWTQSALYLFVYRSGEMVGGTTGCV